MGFPYPSRRDFVGTTAATLASQVAGEPTQAVASEPSFRDHLLACLGGHDGYRIESLDYQGEPGERVPALLLVPDGVSAAHPAPAALRSDRAHTLKTKSPSGSSFSGTWSPAAALPGKTFST